MQFIYPQLKAVQGDYFCTCGDTLLRRARSLRDLQINVISALELMDEIEK
jgi:hypothetical protein